MRLPQKWIGSAAAVALASCVFAGDAAGLIRGPVPVLYTPVLMLAGLDGGLRRLKIWTALCLLLAIASFALHAAPDAEAVLWLLTALAMIAATDVLLVTREAPGMSPIGLERRVRELRTFADSVPSLLWSTRADGRCDFINQRFADLTGMSVIEAIADQSWTKPIHPDDVSGFLETWDEARRRGEEFRTNFRLRHRDGSYRWMLSIGRPFRAATGEIVRWYGGLSDVDAEVRAQETIRALNAALARKVEERTGELLTAQQELARANRVATLGALSVSIAHELNQPLSSMAIDIDTSLRTLQTETPDKTVLRRILERVQRNTQRLSDIVERTRERISRQRRKAERLNLADIAEDVRGLLEHDVAARQAVLRLKYDGALPSVSADRIELQQVFINLIVNALDAMASAEQRVVEVWIRQASAQVLVSVMDTGPGISDEIMTKLFQPFFTTKSGGIGMGLQICRTCIEALGGELHARNRPEGGAVFEFALPVSPEVPNRRAP
ncbi:sensor histidine kinase [Rhizomicrobium electricum]|uniref:histidine kinase n=1 Tax=Rhizomicrobium electricum TaxID=480070 RepID=A0ABN1ERY1_9PROT|nr:ATP-binding protein [Rhizomicrobium electricum]NIJ49051.1 PAS domain S-box-containing protein [Rhizomicrobium electricum]